MGALICLGEIQTHKSILRKFSLLCNILSITWLIV